MLHRVADFRGKGGPPDQSERSTQAIRFYGDQRFESPLLQRAVQCEPGASATGSKCGDNSSLEGPRVRSRLPPPVSLANFRSRQKAPLGSAVTGTDRRKPLQLWRGSQKVAHETCYRCRVLEVRRMTGARDDMDPRIGEALRELVGIY